MNGMKNVRVLGDLVLGSIARFSGASDIKKDEQQGTKGVTSYAMISSRVRFRESCALFGGRKFYVVLLGRDLRVWIAVAPLASFVNTDRKSKGGNVFRGVENDLGFHRNFRKGVQ